MVSLSFSTHIFYYSIYCALLIVTPLLYSHPPLDRSKEHMLHRAVSSRDLPVIREIARYAALTEMSAEVDFKKGRGHLGEGAGRPVSYTRTGKIMP